MPTTQMTFTWNDSETLIDITYHRTGPAFVITNMTEAMGWPIVPDAWWSCVEDDAHDYVATLVTDEYGDDEDPQADALRDIARGIVRAEQRRAV